MIRVLIYNELFYSVVIRPLRDTVRPRTIQRHLPNDYLSAHQRPKKLAATTFEKQDLPHGQRCEIGSEARMHELDGAAGLRVRRIPVVVELGRVYRAILEVLR